MASNEKTHSRPFLEDYDKKANDFSIFSDLQASKPANTNPLLEPATRERPTFSQTSRPKKIRAILLLLAWLAFVYFFTFYVTTFLNSNTDDLLSAIQNLPSKIETDISERIHLILDPPTQDEITLLLTELYTLLSLMGYYPASMISHPPHNINTTLALETGLSSSAIQLISNIPYINTTGHDLYPWNYGSFGNEFILGGQFADLREDDILRFRDPFFQLMYQSEEEKAENKGFDDDGGPYMREDYIFLSTISQDGVVMILDAKTLKLWTISSYDQELQNADPATEHLPNTEISPNYLSFENYPSRLARDALRDYIEKFRSLAWIPGNLFPGTYESDSFAGLYKQNGWPNTTLWDRENFLKDVKEWQESEEKRWQDEEPFEVVDRLEKSIESYKRTIAWKERLIQELDEGRSEKTFESKGEKETYRRSLEEEVHANRGYIGEIIEMLGEKRTALQAIDPSVGEKRRKRIEKYKW